jgi:hypothetical protein
MLRGEPGAARTATDRDSAATRPPGLHLLAPFLLFLGSLGLPVDSPGGTFAAFGPEAYVRGTGQPVVVTASFAVPAANVSCTLEIQNGGLEDSELERVSSSNVGLNGVQVIGPSEFNQNVGLIRAPVAVSTTNELSVELRGKPGGVIFATIVCADEDLPEITASVAPPPNAAGWHDGDVTVTFSCTDATSGIASCTDPVTLSSEGADQIVAGVAVDLAGNTASTSVQVSIDRTPPIVTVAEPADGAVVGEALQACSGSLSEAASLTLDGQPVELVGPDNSFDCGPLTLLEGLNSFLFAATDPAGNVGQLGLSVTLVIPVVTVPDVLHRSQPEAQAAVAGAGLVVGDLGEEYRITMPTGVVVGQSPAPGTEAPEGSAVDLVLVRPPPAGVGEVIPDAWVGEWEIALSFEPVGILNVGAVEEVTDAICPGDVLGLSLVQEALIAHPEAEGECPLSTASDDLLEASCWAEVANECVLHVSMDFSMSRNGDTLTGTGEWGETGDCGALVNDLEYITLSGVRLSTDPGPLCALPPSSLVQKFLRHPFILPLVEGAP